jgi:hypothetical protein
MGGVAGDGRQDQVCRSSRHEDARYPTELSGRRTICGGCRERLEEDLLELPALYELCAHMLDLRRHHLGERVSGHRPRGIALNEAVVTVRTDILGVLASWCGLVSAERDVPGPDELGIRQLTTFLSIHLGWLGEHPSAPDLVDEVTEIARSAQELLRPPTGRPLTLGQCARPGCEELVRAEGHADGEPVYRLSCAAGHAWAPDEWLLLWGGSNGHKRNSFPEGAE